LTVILNERALAARHALGRLIRRVGADPPISTDYHVVDGGAARELQLGWQRSGIVARQQRAFDPLLERLRTGSPRQDFVALADAVRSTHMHDPAIIEVGCATGWNAEVLERLLDRPVRYVGVDYSTAMVTAAAQRYPRMRFAAGDARRLPIADGACDVVISGTVLMHVPDYAVAIAESCRVTRRWAIFHTVPLVQDRATTFLVKKAYGERVAEVVFNGRELRDRFRSAGLLIREEVESVPYDLLDVLGEPTSSLTFLCEKA
jgi:SAM-dependent methyltransferase